MRLLLDSRAIVLWMTGREMPERVTRALLDERNHVAVSAASLWELGIKQAKGNLPVSTAQLDGLLDAAFAFVSVTPEHALAAARLPPVHGDPFDRLLVAQALSEAMTLVGGDQVFAAYGADVLWD